MKNLTIKIPSSVNVTKDTLACVGLFLFLIRKPIMTAMLYLLKTSTEFNTVFAAVLMYIPLLLIPFTKGTRRNIRSFILVWLTVLMVCMVTYLLHPEYEYWLFKGQFNVWDFIFAPSEYLYMMLFILLVNDAERIIKVLKWAGLILLAYNVYKLIYAEFVRGYWVSTGIGSAEGVKGEYNLAFGYDVLFLFVLYTFLGKLEKRKVYYMMAAVALACILLAGSRGPLIGVTLTVLVVVIDAIRSKAMVNRIILTVLMVAAVAVILVNMDFIMQYAGIVLKKLGVSSRTIESLASGQFADDSGRVVLWGIAVDLIRAGGPFGNGMYADRYVISEKTTMWIGYCHNIVLELLVDFGYLLGGVILIVLVWRIVKNLRAPESNWRIVYLIFLISASQLLLSDSFWYSMPFWGCLAVDICWNCNGSGKKPKAAGRSLRIRLPGKI